MKRTLVVAVATAALLAVGLTLRQRARKPDAVPEVAKPLGFSDSVRESEKPGPDPQVMSDDQTSSDDTLDLDLIRRLVSAGDLEGLKAVSGTASPQQMRALYSLLSGVPSGTEELEKHLIQLRLISWLRDAPGEEGLACLYEGLQKEEIFVGPLWNAAAGALGVRQYATALPYLEAKARSADAFQRRGACTALLAFDPKRYLQHMAGWLEEDQAGPCVEAIGGWYRGCLSEHLGIVVPALQARVRREGGEHSERLRILRLLVDYASNARQPETHKWVVSELRTLETSLANGKESELDDVRRLLRHCESKVQH